jgi:hypothetical protein
MLTRVIEHVTSFVIWYALWQLADFILKVQR